MRNIELFMFVLRKIYFVSLFLVVSAWSSAEDIVPVSLNPHHLTFVYGGQCHASDIIIDWRGYDR